MTLKSKHSYLLSLLLIKSDDIVTDFLISLVIAIFPVE